jgi:hypothetical protein
MVKHYTTYEMFIKYPMEIVQTFEECENIE